jgi:glycosyltransferase involved in cell wall biosynthesis
VDASVHQVFLGGINLFLQQSVPLFRRLPPWLDHWLNRPGLIRLLARDAGVPSQRVLGDLTLSMLRGSHGHQRKEVERLTHWLQHGLKPQLINLTNILIAGCLPDVKQTMNVPIVVTLQGDDVFLDMLSADDRRQAIVLIQELAQHVDMYVVFNRWYAGYMQQYLGLPTDKFQIVPLGINLDDFQQFGERGERPAHEPFTIGYLARLAPEKGLHLLVDAFIHLSRQSPTRPPRLLLAGWLGKQHRAYAQQQFNKLRRAGLDGAFEYLGAVDREQKLRFLAKIDVLSVPTVYQDPKGLYVLEALASGVPVVQPNHGAFPELLESTSGGCLVPPHDWRQLAATLLQLMSDPERCRQLGKSGQANVALRHSADVMARETWRLYQRLL